MDSGTEPTENGGSYSYSGSSNTTGGANATGGAAAGGAVQNGGQTQAGASSGGAPPASGGTSHSGGTTTYAGQGPMGGGGATAMGGAPSGGTSAKGGAGGQAGNAAGGFSGTVPKFCGNITTRNSIDTGGMKFSHYWDQITPENAGKWGSVQSNVNGTFNWSTLDAIYAYTQTNNIIFKHHNFVWGSQQPSGTPTQAQVENWIKSFCQRYPATKLIDVVNEPPPHTTPNYTKNLGAGETGTYGWITKAFKLSRQYCGNAILILNDYNNIEYTDQLNHFVDIVTQIKAGGAPIDAVGAQAHGLHGMSATNTQNNINTLASKTGLPVYITEFDIADGNDANQSSIFQAQFEVFWKTASVHGVTVWGWINGATWETNSGLVNGTTPRPAMKWLMGELGRPVPPN